MKLKLYSAIFLLLMAFAPLTQAVLPLPKESNLIEFSSRKSEKLLEQSMNSNSLKLLSHFVTQTTTTYCGVASLVMVLNSSGLKAPLDTKHSTPEKPATPTQPAVPAQPFYYFNQDDFFNDQVMKIITPDVVLKKGITLDQLNEIALAYGLTSKAYHADQFRSLNDFRNVMIKALANKKFIIVNFARSALGTLGGGHHSPLAAYDEKRDRFLLLDVAKYKYPPYWVKTKDLWKAINTEDSDAANNKWRGILVMANNSRPAPSEDLEEDDQLETQE